jgi:photosystem II protein PsbQ
MSNELQTLIQRRDWIDVSNFIHGPLGELRLEMINISRSLLPPDQEKARLLTRDLFDNLVKIDQAAKDGQYQKVMQNYREALADIDNFLQLVPTSSQQEQS